jgi:predicted molibdopterin-dependent oxidoreductase YjgC
MIFIDGEAVEVPAGSLLGHALHGLKDARLRVTQRVGQPRGLFCCMGICFDCLVEIDGRTGVRACIVPVRNKMRVETGS